MFVIRSWLQILGPFKKRALLLFCLLCLSAVIETLSIGSILPLMNTIISGQSGAEASINSKYWGKLTPDARLIMVVTLVVLVFFVRAVVTLLKDYLSADFANSLRHMWSREIFKNLAYGRFSEIRSEKQGHVINAMINEPIYASKGVRALLSLIVSLLMTVAICILLALINFWITVVALSLVMSSILLVWKLSSKYSSAVGLERVEYNQKINHLIADSVNGIRQIKIFSVENRIVTEIDRLVKNLMRLMTRFAVFSSAPKAVGEFLVIIIIMVALCFGRFVRGLDIVNLLPEITVFSIALVKLFSMGSLFLSKRMEVKTYWPSIKLVHSRTGKFKSKDITADNQISQFNKTISFCDVSFGFNKSNDVLSEVSIELYKGQIIGLVGKSGSGKSTICDLLSKFVEPSSGKILVDGAPLSDMSQKNWLKNIGYVSQDAFLFNETIKENIKLGSDLASDRDVLIAAKAANAHDFILELPDQYNTIIGTSGVGLSGGQKQRIALAQALIRKPDILILDEFTSALDVENEKIIMMNLRSLFADSLILMVTHRISSLMFTDNIYLLKDGLIAESGTYQELNSGDNLLNHLMRA